MNAPVETSDTLRAPPEGAPRKVVIARPGSYDRLVLERFAPLLPGPDEVVVDVRASGVNYADSIVRLGLYASAKEFVGWPITPGFEVAGVVRAVGARVTDLAVGTRVVAVTLFGGYASEVAVARPYVFPIPAGLDFAAAAGFPAVYLTAYYAVHELAHPRKGARVLVHSAAGGVGGALVQLCKLAGCEVTAVVGAPHKIDTARAQGADHVLDKSTAPLWKEAERLAPQGFDVVFDANGVATLGQSYAHLRPAGKLVVYGFHSMMKKGGSGRVSWPKLAFDYLRTPRFNPLDMTNDSKSVLAFNLSYLFDRRDILAEAMERLVGWLEQGDITAPPTKSYPFERVADAQRALESGQTVGKLVLTHG
ncbi:MAG: zinc-binding dehydrogenase [Polyangiaceae bacterium]|nr:zinc-binding dehydrogenase [Polyangiaceae bacterium]